jgi:hypothetical protein
LTVSYLKDIKKLFFFLSTQTFAAYEKDNWFIWDLLIWGENINTKGLFFTNWKAEKRQVHLMMSGFALELQHRK